MHRTCASSSRRGSGSLANGAELVERGSPPALFRFPSPLGCCRLPLCLVGDSVGSRSRQRRDRHAQDASDHCGGGAGRPRLFRIRPVPGGADPDRRLHSAHRRHVHLRPAFALGRRAGHRRGQCQGRRARAQDRDRLPGQSVQSRRGGQERHADARREEVRRHLRRGVPFVVANASATSIAERSGVGGNKWTFKVNPTDASMLDALVGWLDKEGNANNIAFLGEDTDFGRAGSTGLENALKKRNLKLATVDFFQKGAPDFTPVFTKIKAKKPALLALYAVDADFQNAMRQWYSLGGGVPLTGRVLVDQVPKEIMDSGFLDGTTSVQPYDPSVDTPGNRAFVEGFKKLHNVPPILVSFEAYEAHKVLIDAIRRAGNTSPAAVREALVTTKLPSMLGTTIEFDDDSLVTHNARRLPIRGGKVVVVGMSKT